MSELLLNLYKKMYLIREAEAEIQREYTKDEMKTPMHMSLGGEAVAAGICQALPADSHGYGTYRSHALYLAWTEETDKFFAELYGKASGTAGGKAGSMHLASPEHGLMAASAVVGTTIPLAIGDAFAAKYNSLDRITVSFFGDGATDEGVFWESLNAACLWQLPILFVCEDNDLAIHISKKRRRGFDSLTNIVRNFKCGVFEDVGNDVEKIFYLACAAINSIRRERRPSLLYLPYFRVLEHVGVNKDFAAGYRSEQEFLEWQKKDPLN
ncbi:MAG: thiamine pyrophosphate-dependent dehydrogenase E1 component subunit alpha, partial [Candidatus Yanofskybacteria bacterium]|nr:thiamine pyrophosphate-dependent dehydrogenase E1 component subunit alpha [Candidatus Yanofskybacteria bacterium]